MANQQARDEILSTLESSTLFEKRPELKKVVSVVTVFSLPSLLTPDP